MEGMGDALKMIPYIALILTIAGVVIGATAIVMDKFGDTSTVDKCYNASYTYNSTRDECVGGPWFNGQMDNNVTVSRGQGGKNFTDAYYSIQAAMDGNTSVAEQQGTVAIIAVMVIVISLIGGVFAYMKYFA
jgi:hypothetical protein